RLCRVIYPMTLVVVSDLRHALLKFAIDALCEDLLYIFAVGKQNMRTVIPGKAIAREAEDVPPVVRLGFVNLAAHMTDVERCAEPRYSRTEDRDLLHEISLLNWNQN